MAEYYTRRSEMPKKVMKGAFDEKAVKNVIKMVKENEIKIIDLKFNDLPGMWQHFSIPATEVTEIDDPATSIWVEGIGFDGSSIRGFQKIHESDMILQLDPAPLSLTRLAMCPP